VGGQKVREGGALKMDPKSRLTLKKIVDFIRLSRPDGQSVFYKDWTRIEDTDPEFWEKDEFRCDLCWERNVKLYDMEAQEYIHYAKQYLRDDSEKGRLDALRNADEARKCRVDEILKLLNLTALSSRKRWDLPKKIQTLEAFGVPNLEILKTTIASPRNRLVHQHVRPEQKEARDAVEVADLFLQATNQWIEKGFMRSATVAYDSWFKPAVLAATWFGGKVGQSVSTNYGYQDGFSQEYRLTLDLEREMMTLLYLHKEVFRRCHLKSGKEAGHKESVIETEGPLTIPLYECQADDIINLMGLLRERDKG